MIRIMYIIATLDPCGAERQLCKLAGRLDRSRFRPTVCCLTRGGAELEDELRRSDTECLILGKKWKLDISILRPLARLIRGREADIVHTWLFTANAFGRVAALLARTPVIIASQRVADPNENSVYGFVDRQLAKMTDMVICNSSRVLEDSRTRLHVPSEKLAVIPNGVDVYGVSPKRSENAVRTELGLGPDCSLVCSAGRLAEQKRFDLLIEAASHLKRRGLSVRTVIAGEGHLRSSLERKIRLLALEEEVQLLGYRPDISEIMAASDVFVLSSCYEGMPNVVMEAMALGKPVVTTDVEGISELITDGRSGVVVPQSASAARLADAVQSLLEDRERAAEMGRNARADILDNFTIEQMTARYEHIYADLTSRSN